jgi:hypothetical protein
MPPRAWLSVICIAALLMWLAPPTALVAETGIAASEEEELRILLEKSLSITEIDKEIGRIAEQREAMTVRIGEAGQLIEAASLDVERHREQAGRVLRAYYTGERDLLLGALVSFDSVRDLLAMLDYFDVIVSHDKHTLDNYRKQQQSLVQQQDVLIKDEQRLAEIERSLLTQRERIVKLQAEVDGALASSGDEARLRLLIEELLLYWQNTGLVEVKRYFRALGEAMTELPAWLSGNKQLLEIDGFNYTLRLPAEELNGFLREQDPLFHQFEFRFEDGFIIAHGRREGVEVDVKGRYTIEDEPKHAIRFHTEVLKFNGLELPDTTRRALEKEFDLSFYPQMLVSFVRATSVKIEDGELIVKLRVELSKR